MSVVIDQIRRLDAQLDRLPVLHAGTTEGVDGRGIVVTSEAKEALSSPRVNELSRILKSLSTTSSSNALLPSWRISLLLSQSGLCAQRDQADLPNAYESDIEWLLVSKATVQTYGAILNTLLDQILPLSNDIWYWDEVVSSYTWSSLYAVQTSPTRMLAMSRDVSREAWERFQSLQRGTGDLVGSAQVSLSNRWRRFYGVVKDSLRERSLSNIQHKLLSPVAFYQNEARAKRERLKKLREMIASGIGVLVDEGLAFGPADEQKDATSQTWKGVVARSVALMDMVLENILLLNLGTTDFEDTVFASVEDDPELSIHIDDIDAPDKPEVLARRLYKLLETRIPKHTAATRQIVKENGRPSAVVRYWLPLGLGLLFSTTLLRIASSHRAEIVAWVRDLGATVRDFWINWVVEPSLKVLRTIRHDANSEIALMSRDSLRADRESLERMVVDFAVDRPHFAAPDGAAPHPLSPAEVAELRARVAAGDVTPVLRAYERDLRSPLRGAVRGDLVRSLLIQVQKTKVDLEVAVGGIDALLRSQELVFGFVGLTPGILVSVGAVQYLRGVLGGRSGRAAGRRADRCVRTLRNADRILAEAVAAAGPQQNGVLSYRDHGLLLCEVHVLRSLVKGSLPREVERELLEDLDDLANTKGIPYQVRALERIRWAYARWIK